jgi:glycosyltransferase involved in cell wall biosynthesis
MKILWLTAISFIKADVSFKNLQKERNTSGGWIINMLSALSGNCSDFEFYVISINNNNSNAVFEKESIKFNTFKANPTSLRVSWNLKKQIKDAVKSINPDLIDVQGVEFSFSNIDFGNCLTCYTIQGLPFELYKYQRMQKLGMESFRCQSIMNILTLRNFYTHNIYMKARGNNSIEILKEAKLVIGRTSWDRSISTYLNPSVNYFVVNRILRDEFFNQEWNADNLSEHTIFTINFSSINKGADVLLKSLYYIKQTFNDVKLLIPGTLNTSFLSGKWYDRYIHNLISKLDLKDNIIFLGNLNASKMATYLSNSSIFVSPSLNENSSNSIAEAQIVGIPVVAALTGGNCTYIDNNHSGVLYNQWDEFMCAEVICKLFSNKELCVEMSKFSRQISRERHNKEAVARDLINVYMHMIEGAQNE